jgi:putative NADH-flavin reductase
MTYDEERKMKIAVYGASGMVGSRVAAEAVRRGHQVIGVTRSGGALPEGVVAVEGDAGDAASAKAVASDADVLVSVIGPSRTGGDHQEYLDALRVLAENAGDARLIVVGGAGSLLADGVRLVDGPGFPDAYKPEALTAATGLDYFRGLTGEVDWTYLSPAPVIAPGERTGTYLSALDSPAGDTISAEDFAVALVDEIERPAHRRQRFTVAN